MNKRNFLGATGAVLTLPVQAAAASGDSPSPILLTITGNVGRTNRGPFNPVLDVMMSKQKLSFDKAYAVNYGALLRLPQRQIAPRLEYDAQVHRLRGPRLLDVVALATARLRDKDRLVLRAVDGYASVVTVEEARRKGFIVATHLDGQPMALGGLGPLWALFDADRVPDVAARPLLERYAGCPWALYHIEVLT